MINLDFITPDNVENITSMMYELMYILSYDEQYIDYSYDGPPKIDKEYLLKDGITPEKIKHLRRCLDEFQIGLKFYKEWNYLPDEYHLSDEDIRILITICHWYVKIYERCDFLEFKEKPNLTWEQEQFIKTVTFLENQLEK